MLPPPRHLKVPEIVFIAAACFAMAMVGFFTAVYLQLHTSKPAAVNTLSSLEDKQTYMQQVAENSNKAAVQVLPSQADGSDTQAAEKLKIMQALAK